MGEDEDLARMPFMRFTYRQRPRNMTLDKLGIFEIDWREGSIQCSKRGIA
jgi:hypothetical protein